MNYDILVLTEIDTLQFQPGWARTDETLLRQAINRVHSTERWLINASHSAT